MHFYSVIQRKIISIIYSVLHSYSNDSIAHAAIISKVLLMQFQYASVGSVYLVSLLLFAKITMHREHGQPNNTFPVNWGSDT